MDEILEALGRPPHGNGRDEKGRALAEVRAGHPAHLYAHVPVEAVHKGDEGFSDVRVNNPEHLETMRTVAAPPKQWGTERDSERR